MFLIRRRRPGLLVLASAFLGLALASCGDEIGEGAADDLHMAGVEVGHFSSLDELVQASDVVVVGSVVRVEPGRVMDFGEPEEPIIQVLDVTVEVSEVIKGEAGKTVAIEWMGWSATTRTSDDRRAIVINGIGAPERGQDVLWFLKREEGSIGGADRHELVSLDGMYTVADGKVTSGLDSPRLGTEVSGTDLSDMRAHIKSVLQP